MQPRRIRTMFWLLWKLASLRLLAAPNFKAQMNREVFMAFSELGGLYIKFLQALALNDDFLENWAGPSELSVFESAGTEQIAIYEYLKSEIGQANIASFASIQTKPFAAGSFGQVYKAQLKDGTSAVVKVLKPSLHETLGSDLRLLGIVVSFMQVLKPSSMIDYRAIYKDFAAITIAETDYEQELKNTNWFHNYFKNNLNVIVPFCYENLSSKRVITQDYIDGVSVAEVAAKAQLGMSARDYVQSVLGSDLWSQLEMLGQELVHASIWSDFMPGDPHPGNIKLLPNNKVGLIDFGIVARTPTDKLAYVELLASYRNLFTETFDSGSFMVAMLKAFDKNLALSLAAIGNLEPTKAQKVFKTISDTASATFDKQINHGDDAGALDNKQIIKIFNRVINNGNRYGLRFDVQSAATIKAARTYLQVLRQLAVDGEDIRIMQHVLTNQTVFANKHLSALPQKQYSQEPSIDVALETIGEWLSEVAANDPSLYMWLNATIRSYNYA